MKKTFVWTYAKVDNSLTTTTTIVSLALYLYPVKRLVIEFEIKYWTKELDRFRSCVHLDHHHHHHHHHPIRPY